MVDGTTIARGGGEEREGRTTKVREIGKVVGRTTPSRGGGEEREGGQQRLYREIGKLVGGTTIARGGGEERVGGQQMAREIGKATAIGEEKRKKREDNNG